MDRLARSKWTTEDLVCPVGDDLFGVGVRGRPRAGLEDIDDEVLVELALLDFLGGLLNRVGDAGLEQAELSVDEGRRALDLRQRADEPAWEPQVADREVLPRAFGARPIVGIGGRLPPPPPLPFCPPITPR